MRGLPSSRQHRADVARDLRGGPPVGPIDQGAGRQPRDAAVASRQGRRDPEVHQRSIAQRRADRHHRPVDRRRGAAGRHEGHAAAEAVAERRSVLPGGRAGSARPRGASQAVHDAGAGARRPLRNGSGHPADRAAMGPCVRDEALAEGPANRPPREHVSDPTADAGGDRGRAGGAGRTAWRRRW